MERMIRNITIALVVILFVVQGYLFFKENDEKMYASQGEKMSETTWLYARDTLTIQVFGELPEVFQIWKNGEPLELTESSGGVFVMDVKTYDLIEISGKTVNDIAVEVSVTLKNDVFQENFYADIFDYTGGRVTVGWFVEK